MSACHSEPPVCTRPIADIRGSGHTFPVSRGIIIVGVIAAVCLGVALLSALRSSYIVWDRGSGLSAPRVINGIEVHTSDMPAIADALFRSSAEPRYAAFTFGTADRPSDEDAINLQISVERDKLGVDWVLLAPRNIQDQAKFATFVRGQGFEPVTRTMNGVSYLRVDTADAALLATRVVHELYQLPPNASLGLFHEGFDWPAR